jgi:hypothetical protein
MLEQNLAAVSTATLVRKFSPMLPPYTASDIWDEVHDGVLVESEIIWWYVGELTQFGRYQAGCIPRQTFGFKQVVCA